MIDRVGLLKECEAFLAHMELKQRRGHGLIEERVNEAGETVLRIKTTPYGGRQRPK